MGGCKISRKKALRKTRMAPYRLDPISWPLTSSSSVHCRWTSSQTVITASIIWSCFCHFNTSSWNEPAALLLCIACSDTWWLSSSSNIWVVFMSSSILPISCTNIQTCNVLAYCQCIYVRPYGGLSMYGINSQLIMCMLIVLICSLTELTNISKRRVKLRIRAGYN